MRNDLQRKDQIFPRLTEVEKLVLLSHPLSKISFPLFFFFSFPPSSSLSLSFSLFLSILLFPSHLFSHIARLFLSSQINTQQNQWKTKTSKQISKKKFKLSLRFTFFVCAYITLVPINNGTIFKSDMSKLRNKIRKLEIYFLGRYKIRCFNSGGDGNNQCNHHYKHIGIMINIKHGTNMWNSHWKI
jgi:hypothetical protein